MTAQASTLTCPPVTGCACGAHAQHEVFRVLWHSPGITLKAAAEQLKIPYGNTKRYASRLRRKGLSNRCPECFSPTLFRLVCHSCGVDLSEKGFSTESVSSDSSSPVYRLQGGSGLGGHVAYDKLRLRYGGQNIAHIVDKFADPRFERLKSRLWQGLKTSMPRDDVCEDAVSMLKRDYLEALNSYPGIESWRGFGDAVLGRVWRRLRLFYPSLPQVVPPALTSKKAGKGVEKPDILGKEFETA